jgi:hypothetical protein
MAKIQEDYKHAINLLDPEKQTLHRPGSLVIIITAVLLIFTFMGIPGGGKLFGLTVNGYNIEPGADLRNADMAGADLERAQLASWHPFPRYLWQSICCLN